VFPETHGRLSLLDHDTIVLGRDDDCTIRLPGEETSRKHAEIRRDGPVSIVRDLDSRNGVFVGGERIDEAPLAPGKVLRLGEWIGIVVEVPADHAEPSPVFGELAPGLWGGPALHPVLHQAKVAAPASLPTVLLGETGTGKEGVARAMHAWSGRPGPFVAVNCATLVPTLAEAELFGYRKGAFTGADRPSPGFFRTAQGGTLLLDEVTDLPESVQAKLLRALEQREIVPLGESLPVPVDVRVLAATQIPLGQVASERRFRSDLCARLDGLTIRLPPLRERKEEIAFLFAHLLRRHAGGVPPAVEPRLVERLCLYDWPFNVRELGLLAQRLLVLHGSETLLRRSHLPEQMLEPRPRGEPPADSAGQSHAERRKREMAALVQGLRAHGGNVARAAAAAGISRQRAYRLMEVERAEDARDEP
jgi:transcriptional regulator with PAS, ATPase and Fis domain